VPAKETAGDPAEGDCSDVIGAASEISQVHQLPRNSLWPLMGGEQVSDFLIVHYRSDAITAQKKGLALLDFYAGKGQLHRPVTQGAGQLPMGWMVHYFTGGKLAVTHQFSSSGMVFAKLLQGISGN
jgi:hypothetical protein